jgi:hypothetical protein
MADILGSLLGGQGGGMDCSGSRPVARERAAGGDLDHSRSLSPKPA